MSRTIEKAQQLMFDAMNITDALNTATTATNTKKMASDAYNKYHEALTIFADLRDSGSLHAANLAFIEDAATTTLFPMMEKMHAIAKGDFETRLNSVNAASAAAAGGAGAGAGAGEGAGAAKVEAYFKNLRMPTAPSGAPGGSGNANINRLKMPTAPIGAPNVPISQHGLQTHFKTIMERTDDVGKTLGTFFLFMHDVLPTLSRSGEIKALFNLFHDASFKTKNANAAIRYMQQILKILDDKPGKLGTTKEQLYKKFLKQVSGGANEASRRLAKHTFGNWSGGGKRCRTQRKQIRKRYSVKLR